MRIIITPVRETQFLSSIEPIKHWYGTTHKRRTRQSYVDTYEYEVTELSNELQMLVDAMYKDSRKYSMSKLEEDILKVKNNMSIQDEDTIHVNHNMEYPDNRYLRIGDDWYDISVTRNSLMFTPREDIRTFYENIFDPLPKQDNTFFIQQVLLKLEDEIKYVIKLHNTYKTRNGNGI